MESKFEVGESALLYGEGCFGQTKINGSFVTILSRNGGGLVWMLERYPEFVEYTVSDGSEEYIVMEGELEKLH